MAVQPTDSVLAVDIGGTKVAAGLVDGHGTVLVRREQPTAGTGDPERLFHDVVALTEAVRAGHGSEPAACGVGCGGPMAGGLVSPVNIPAWREFPLEERLGQATGLVTAVDNDAKALARGEGWVGGAVGRSDYLAMVVSTGIGGGIVSGGRLLDGALGNAGHIGWTWVGDTEVTPGAGWRDHPAGLLETEASGTGLAERTGRPASEASVAERRRAGTLVGRAVASVANLLDLELALVAGSVALGFGQPFFEAAQAELDRLCVLSYSRGAVIVPAGLGADGPLVGAAAVGWAAVGGPPSEETS